MSRGPSAKPLLEYILPFVPCRDCRHYSGNPANLYLDFLLVSKEILHGSNQQEHITCHGGCTNHAVGIPENDPKLDVLRNWSQSEAEEVVRQRLVIACARITAIVKLLLLDDKDIFGRHCSSPFSASLNHHMSRPDSVVGTACRKH